MVDFHTIYLLFQKDIYLDKNNNSLKFSIHNLFHKLFDSPLANATYQQGLSNAMKGSLSGCLHNYLLVKGSNLDNPTQFRSIQDLFLVLYMSFDI